MHAPSNISAGSETTPHSFVRSSQPSWIILQGRRHHCHYCRRVIVDISPESTTIMQTAFLNLDTLHQASSTGGIGNGVGPCASGFATTVLSGISNRSGLSPPPRLIIPAPSTSASIPASSPSPPPPPPQQQQQQLHNQQHRHHHQSVILPPMQILQSASPPRHDNPANPRELSRGNTPNVPSASTPTPNSPRNGSGGGLHPRLQPTLAGISKQHRVKEAMRSKRISYDRLSSTFHMKIVDASRTLGVSVSLLQKICRQYGVSRWPYRKLSSVSRQIKDLEQQMNDSIGLGTNSPSEEDPQMIPQQEPDPQRGEVSNKLQCLNTKLHDLQSEKNALVQTSRNAETTPQQRHRTEPALKSTFLQSDQHKSLREPQQVRQKQHFGELQPIHYLRNPQLSLSLNPLQQPHFPSLEAFSTSSQMQWFPPGPLNNPIPGFSVNGSIPFHIDHHGCLDSKEDSVGAVFYADADWEATLSGSIGEPTPTASSVTDWGSTTSGVSSVSPASSANSVQTDASTIVYPSNSSSNSSCRSSPLSPTSLRASLLNPDGLFGAPSAIGMTPSPDPEHLPSFRELLVPRGA